VPVVLVDVSDKESLEIAIIENVQRSDLNPLEEAEGYADLIREFSYTQADLAKIIGKSRSHVANTIRLANLPAPVKQFLEAGKLSAGHARALLSAAEPERLAQKIVSEGLTVRDAERLAQSPPDAASLRNGEVAADRKAKDPNTLSLEKSLREATGLVIDIKNHGEAGELHIKYKTLEQLDEICRHIANFSARQTV
jgi:ParB family chromosome partitioning protein